ncbi:ParA family protein [Hyphomicrobium sp. ghe19]|uniref:ParA family protein n=1 Tax=Hyphomicrobium sp. ghe19 TaxID=2682968 RepID=UPI00136709F2|nr:Chromosome-partitioning ATPase Soj [Hyphomicrobium sp. ghe19]
MAIRVAVANPKGGVGKSMTTMMVAEGLALHFGARVLVLDMDPQAGVTKLLLGHRALDDLKSRQVGLGSILKRWSNGGGIKLAAHCEQASDLIDLRAPRTGGFIDLVPSNHELLGELSAFEDAIRQSKRKDRLDVTLAALIDSAVKQIEKHYHVVLFDCPAGPVALGLASLRCVQHVISPINLEDNSYTTLKDFLHFILDDDLGLWSRVTVHPLITMYHATNPVQRQMLDQIASGLYGLNAIRRPIPYAAALQIAQMHQGPGSYRSQREKYGTALAEVTALANAIAERIQLKVSRAPWKTS